MAVSSSLTSTGVVPRRTASRLPPLGGGGRTAAAVWLNEDGGLEKLSTKITFSSGVCCANLEEPAALMKMGLSMVLVGHVNFLLGALVHGVVLRHINLHKQARAMEYAISNVVALASGLVGIVVGIVAIVLSKNKKSKSLTWSVFSVSLVSSLMASASAIGLLVSVVRAIIHGGRSLLTHCRFPDAIGYSSITNECPFDPTRIYSTTLILWVPLIVTCVVQFIFSARCLSVCISFLGLPCWPYRKRRREVRAAIKAQRNARNLRLPILQSATLEPRGATANPEEWCRNRSGSSATNLPRRTTGASPQQKGGLFTSSLAGKGHRDLMLHMGARGNLPNIATYWREALLNGPVSGFNLMERDCFYFTLDLN
nr:keratinocyte-associated protein 3-like [Nerophis lumbriciformis]